MKFEIYLYCLASSSLDLTSLIQAHGEYSMTEHLNIKDSLPRLKISIKALASKFYNLNQTLDIHTQITNLVTKV